MSKNLLAAEGGEKILGIYTVKITEISYSSLKSKVRFLDEYESIELAIPTSFKIGLDPQKLGITPSSQPQAQEN